MLPQTRRSTGIPTFIRVLTAVNFLACGGYQRGIGQDFHHALSQAAVSICIKQVCDAINARLLGRWVKFPRTPEKVDRVKVRYV
ncbi:hypothetical protein J437_LFUL011842 [Ladona fulva]|uniref:Nuclease HARBI1 n=1 Tax=Ladona fulva TaxID=123851 RepID=A0A8K0P1R3_LADFU|nr:hypothetical protein J437_LFUL011842 [Ladona fulva]